MTLPIEFSLIPHSYSDQSKLFAILDQEIGMEFTQRTGLRAGDLEYPIYINKSMPEGKGLLSNSDGTYKLFDII